MSVSQDLLLKLCQDYNKSLSDISISESSQSFIEAESPYLKKSVTINKSNTRKINQYCEEISIP